MSQANTSFRPTLDFCNREAELEMLRALVSSPTRGLAGCVVSAEAGLGKTTLAARATEYAKTLGLLVLSVAAKSHAVEAPFSTVQNLVEKAPETDHEAFTNRELLDFWAWMRTRSLRSESPSPRELLADGAEMIFKPLGTVVRGFRSGLEPHFFLQRLLHNREETYVEYLAYLFGSGSVLLVLDDFHWIDAPSVITLARLLEIHHPEGLTALISYRPYECSQNEIAEEFLAGLRDRGFQDLRLSPLPAKLMAVCLREAAPSLSFEVISQVARLSEGNPLLAVEDLTVRLVEANRRTTRSITDDGNLSGEPSQKLQGLVNRRLLHLSPLATEYLHVGACLGQNFALKDVVEILRALMERIGLNASSASMTTLNLIDIPKIVEELGQLGFVRVAPAHEGIALEFNHPLVHEIVHRGLSPSKHLLLHSCIAEFLERCLAAGKPADPSDIGRHHLEAREYRAAFRSFWRGGKVAYDFEVYLRAANLFKRALTCLREASESAVSWSPPNSSLLRCVLLVRSAESLFRSAQFRDAQECALAALETGKSGDADLFKAEAAYWLGKIEYFIGSDEEAIRRYDECAEIFRRQGRTEAVVRTMNAKAASLVQLGKTSQAESVFRSALDLAPEIETRWPTTALEVYQNSGMVLPAAEAVPPLKHGIELAQRGPWPRKLGILWHNLGVEFYYLRQLDDAGAAFAQARELLLQSVSFELLYTLNSLGVLSLIAKKYQAAARYFAQAEQRLVANFDRIWLANNMAILDHREGNTAQGIIRLERLLPLIDAHSDPIIRENSYFNLGVLYSYEGRLEEAEDYVGRSFSRSSRYPKFLVYAKRYRVLARVRTALGKVRQAKRLSRLGDQLFQREHGESWSYMDEEFIYCHLCNYH